MTYGWCAVVRGWLGLVAACAALAGLTSPVLAQVVISQVYGGGGNTGATLRNDFVELFNRGGTPVSLAGWSVQYASSTGSTWQVTAFSGVVLPGQYFLVQQAQGLGGTQDLPSPDVVGAVSLSATAGKVALVSTTTALSGTCPLDASVVDLVGYGAAANCAELAPTGDLSNTTAALRAANGCTDTDTNSSDFTPGAPNPRNSATVANVCPDTCAAADTPIGTIQGTGTTSPVVGTVATIQGVVVGDYEYPGTGSSSNFLRGFYVQNLPADADGNPATSDGIFVFNGNNNSVGLGQIVQVTGTVAEFDPTLTGVTATQLTTPTITLCAGMGTVTPAPVSLPLADAVALERYEGMLVSLPQTLYVTEHFQLGRFGQVTLSAQDRLRVPTSQTTPGAAAIAAQAQNDLNRIVLDDGSQMQNPDPIVFARGGMALSAANTLRGGDTVTGVTGVLTQTDAASGLLAGEAMLYRVRPVNALNAVLPTFMAGNPRPSTPATVTGRLRVAGFNVLNYFNTFGATGCSNGVGGMSTSCRGAENQTEFDRQWPKIVQGILDTGADVLALSELENDGYGATSAIQDLVNRLDAATAPGTYAFIDVDAGTGTTNALGVDAIRVGLLYKPASVTPVGQTAVLNTGAFGIFTISSPPGTTQRNRPALAQAFEEVATGARFVVVANHLKAKSGPCDDNLAPVGADPDVGDGQQHCNLTRTQAATELASWLAADPTGTGDLDVLIMGDLNAYTKEDPLAALTAAGYVNLIESRIGALAYSFVFDGQWGYLDHALASPTMVPQVASVVEYHSNADEPGVLDYNTNFKSAGQLVGLYATDGFRASDHDPILVGLNLANASVAGTVQYYRGARPVPDVVVDAPSATVTDSLGAFAASLTPGTVVLKPRKLGGDGGAVSAFDASQVLRAVVGLRTFDSDEALACDVTGNGTVSALDAARILQRVVGALAEFPVAQLCGSDWAFVPVPLSVPNQISVPPLLDGACRPGSIQFDPLAGAATSQDFRAILFGDCSGNWQPPALPGEPGGPP